MPIWSFEQVEVHGFVEQDLIFLHLLHALVHQVVCLFEVVLLFSDVQFVDELFNDLAFVFLELVVSVLLSQLVDPNHDVQLQRVVLGLAPCGTAEARNDDVLEVFLTEAYLLVRLELQNAVHRVTVVVEVNAPSLLAGQLLVVGNELFDIAGLQLEQFLNSVSNQLYYH